MDEAPRPNAARLWPSGPARSAATARLGLAGKLAVSAALLAFLSQKVEWPAIGTRLSGAILGPMVGALALLIGLVFVAALRWRLLVQQADVRMPISLAVQLTFAGLFFGQVLPATVGGDVVRGYLACQRGLPWRGVVSGIVLDRITALLGLLILIILGLPWLTTLVAGTPAPLAFAAFASATLACALGAILCIDLIPLPGWIARHPWIGSGLNLAKRVRTGLFSRAGLAALALSLVTHSATVVIVILIGKGLAVPVSLTASFVVVPLAILAAAAPVSLNGWGVREGVIVAGLALFGISAGDALLISILLGVGVILSVLPGSVTWLTSR